MPTADWKRLGELLVRRRIELDPRYSNRRTFSDERGIGYRIVTDLEHGNRGNYEDATISAAEVAYAVTAGSIRRALAGGDLEAAPRPGVPVTVAGPTATYPEPSQAARLLFDGDPLLQRIWDLADATEDERAEMIAVIRRKRQETAERFGPPASAEETA